MVVSWIKAELTLIVSYPNLLCLLEDVKTDMKPVGFQEDQIQILMKMKIMKGREEKEVRELFILFMGGKKRRNMGTFTVLYSSLLSAERCAVTSEPLE